MGVRSRYVLGALIVAGLLATGAVMRREGAREEPRPGHSQDITPRPAQHRPSVETRAPRQPPQQQDTVRARYPKTWEVPLPAGARLDSLGRALSPEIGLLPAKDREDQTPLPIWFRVY